MIQGFSNAGDVDYYVDEIADCKRQKQKLGEQLGLNKEEQRKNEGKARRQRQKMIELDAEIGKLIDMKNGLI